MKDKSSKKAKTTGTAWWKKAAFALGILMVIGAVTYSLIIKPSTSTGSPPAVNAAQSAANSGNTNQPSNSIGDYNWIKKANVLFAKNDFIFLVLPGDNEATQLMSKEIDSAVAKIRADGVNIETLALKSDDPELQSTAQRLSITKFPAVIAFNKVGSGTIVTGDITETRLLQAYLQAAKACPPGSSPGCCP